jgi:peptide chain release factor 1
LENDYSVTVAKKAGELSLVVDALRTWDKANESLYELRKLLSDPSTDVELQALASEDLASTAVELNTASQTLTASLVPKHPFADLPCLIEIRPGAGGGEAGLFAADLLQMYKGYCSENRLRATVLEEKIDEGLGQGLVEAVVSVDSPGAYGLLRCEAGVHRVQRIPETEKMGRTHTSAASVMVLPSFSDGAVDDTDMNNPDSDFYVDPTEVRIDVMRASGAGGQHVNRTESAVRLTHIPTNTVVSIQTGRSQIQNRKTAWEILRSRLAQARREKREEEVLAMRRSVVGVAKIGRGDKIRTYNWSQQRITDHRSGVSVHGIDGFMAGGGNLEKLMESVRKWMVEREVEGMVTEASDTDTKHKNT